MDIFKFKSTLIDKIRATKIAEMLEEIHRFLINQELNAEQQNASAEAREDIKKGRYSSDEEVLKN